MKDPAHLSSEWRQLGILTGLGLLAQLFQVQIPHTAIVIDARWVFGFIGFGLLGKWWSAWLLSAVLSIPLGGNVAPIVGFLGNQLYAVPTLIAIRWANPHLFRRCHCEWRYGGAWAGLIFFCYQAFYTPSHWALLAALRDEPILPNMLAGWVEQPFLAEAVLVSLFSGVAMVALCAQRRLRTARERLEKAFRSDLVAMAISRRRDGMYLEASPGFLKMTRYSYDDIVGHTSRELGFFSDSERQKLVAALAREGELENQELTYPTKDGERRTMLFSIGPIEVMGEDCLLATMVDITDRKAAEEQFRLIVEQSHEVFYKQDLESARFAYVSPGIVELTGDSVEEFSAMTLEEQQARIHPDDLPSLLSFPDDLVRADERGLSHLERQFRMRTRDGAYKWVAGDYSLLRDTQGRPASVVGSLRDVTSELELEEQFRHSQKMEAVGQLAGGVAHDFNNLVMGVLGYVELCRDAIDPDHQAQEWLQEIAQAAQRSSDLSRKLLAFARKEAVSPKLVDLDEAVGGMLKMLRRLVGEDVDIVWQPGTGSATIMIDPGQIDQILVNLSVNARDALGGTGRIALQTQTETVDQAYCTTHTEAVPGDYVVLSVSDDGCGMDRETVQRIFEPFFTTKSSSEGTGLGLSTVYGIVRQNGGFINVDSQPGEGTTFRVYLPLRAVPAEGVEESEGAPAAPGGSETILLVEDEKSIRFTTQRFLKELGYTVFAAADPGEAQRLVTGIEETIDLLVTDVIMPGMTGRELADRLLAKNPATKVLYMSGYTADLISERGVLVQDVNFLPKPSSRHELAGTIREVLDSKQVPEREETEGGADGAEG